jgi:predicted dinucleotide-binding enzyme
MNVTVFGTGDMGHALATRLLAGGHGVTLLGTETAKAEAVAQDLACQRRQGVQLRTLPDARRGNGSAVSRSTSSSPTTTRTQAGGSQLVEGSGLRAVDAGPLRRAHELEAAGLLHMTV